MNAFVIYNKKAGGGKASSAVENVKKAFLKHGIEADIKFTQYAKHAITLVRDADLSKYNAIITVGGDGTFYESLNGYFQNRNRTVINFGIIPIGTGNSLSKDIYDKEYKLEEYVEILSKAKTRPFDIAKYQTENTEMYYINTLGFGLFSDVVVTAIKFKFLGKFAYTIGVLYRMLLLSTYAMKITVDGKVFEMENVLVSVSNSRYTGGNFLIAPDAKLDDGKLDVIILKKLSRINLIKTFFKLFSGTHITSEFVEVIQASTIIIETSKAKVLSPDGELFGKTPVRIESVKGGIRMLINM